MQRKAPLIGITLLTFASTSSLAGDPQDAATCQTLNSGGQAGFYLRNTFGQLQRINGSSISYEPEARVFYLGRSKTGAESIWVVKTQTIARSAKANEAMLWRPAIVSECSNGRPLAAFGRNDRFVSLQRYYQHHALSSLQRVDDDLANKFHMPMKDKQGNCNGRTDSADTVGPLQEIYGFEQVSPGPLMVERNVEPTPALAEQVSAIYSGLTSEIAHVAAGEPICFGFAAPLPTHSTVTAQLFGGIGGPFSSWERYTLALQNAQTWQPSVTTVILRELNGGGRERISVRWARQ